MATYPPLPPVQGLVKNPFPRREGKSSPFLLEVWRRLNLVHPYQMTLYFGVFLWGIYSVLPSTPETVSKLLPDIIYTIWMWIHIVAPLAVWTGQILHAWKPTPRKVLLGWELQWAGDAAICFILATAALIFSQDSSHQYTYLVALFPFWAMCAFGLATRDVIAICYYWGCCHDKDCDTDVDD